MPNLVGKNTKRSAMCLAYHCL